MGCEVKQSQVTADREWEFGAVRSGADFMPRLAFGGKFKADGQGRRAAPMHGDGKRLGHRERLGQPQRW